MAFDLDAWAERSAIMEYDAGLTRFRAETLAADIQGAARHEAIRERDIAQARHQRAAMERKQRQGDLSKLQPQPTQKTGRVPEHNEDTRSDTGELLALRLGNGGEF